MSSSSTEQKKEHKESKQKETKESKRKETKVATKQQLPLTEAEDQPFRSNYTRPDLYRSLLGSAALAASNYGNGSAQSGGIVLSSKDRIWGGLAMKDLPIPKADSLAAMVWDMQKPAIDFPPCPHWVDPNFSFATPAPSLLKLADKWLGVKKIDHEFIETKHKVRGITYIDHYNVEFTIRLYDSGTPRVYICEVQMKKSPVVPFSIFFKKFKDEMREQKLVLEQVQESKRPKRTAYTNLDELDVALDEISLETLEPFIEMLRSPHLAVQKEGLRALLGLAANERNLPMFVKLQPTDKPQATDNETQAASDDVVDWLASINRFLASEDWEMVRLASVFFEQLCSYKNEKFRAHAIKQTVPIALKLLNLDKTLILMGIHRQLMTALRWISVTNVKELLAIGNMEVTNRTQGTKTKTAKEILYGMHRWTQDWPIREAVCAIFAEEL